MELHFNKNLDGSINVETWKDSEGLDYTTLGSLEFDKGQNVWVYWPEDLNNDGVSYYDNLQETKNELKFELENA